MSDSAADQGKAGEVQLIQLGEKKMVGLPVIVAFKDGDFSQIGQGKERFMARKSEIGHIIDSDKYGRHGTAAKSCLPISTAWRSAN